MDNISNQALSTKPIKVYNTQITHNDYYLYIIIAVLLALVGIVFLGLVICLNRLYNQPEVQTCFGNYGVKPNVSAQVVNLCGTNNSTPCIFAKNSLSDCIDECNSIPNICQSFTYNSITNIMQIVDVDTSFASQRTDLYSRNI